MSTARRETAICTGCERFLETIRITTHTGYMRLCSACITDVERAAMRDRYSKLTDRYGSCGLFVEYTGMGTYRIGLNAYGYYGAAHGRQFETYEASTHRAAWEKGRVLWCSQYPQRSGTLLSLEMRLTPPVLISGPSVYANTDDKYGHFVRVAVGWSNDPWPEDVP